MLATILLLPAAVGATWLACGWLAPVYEPYRSGFSVSMTCGGGDYSKKTFRLVNDELPAKLDALLGDRASLDHLAAVLPDIAGYTVKILGPPASKLGDDGLDRELSEWIHPRMDEVELEIPRDASGRVEER